MAGGMGRLLFVLVASAVVLVQSIFLARNSGGYDGFSAWALICSLISLGLCAGAYVIQLLAPEKCTSTDGMKYFALVLTCLWVGGTGCMTVKQPYPVPGNGYFGAWVSLICCALLMLEFFPTLRQPFDNLVAEGGAPLALMMLASAAVLTQTLHLWLGDGHLTGASTWVIVCSALSLCFCGTLVFIGPINAAARPHWKYISLLFFLWWAVGTSIATFVGPYTRTGNGYFGCWAASIVAAMMASRSWQITANVGDVLQHASLMAGGTPTEFVVIFIASVVTLAASCVVCDHGQCRGFDAWAVACSTISACVCLAVFACKAGLWSAPSFDEKIPIISAFLFVVWVAGTTCMTLERPFREAGNGYFGAWTALMAAWLLTSRSFLVLKQCLQTIGSHSSEVAVLLFASAALLAQAVLDCGQHHITCTEHWAWAVACGATSLVVCVAIVLAYERIQCAFAWIALALFVWWAAAVGFLTFSWPYTTASNAYFACWSGFCASLLMVCREFPRITGGAADKIKSATASIEDAARGVVPEQGNPAIEFPKPNLLTGKSPPIANAPAKVHPAGNIIGATYGDGMQVIVTRSA